MDSFSKTAADLSSPLNSFIFCSGCRLWHHQVGWLLPALAILCSPSFTVNLHYTCILIERLVTCEIPFFAHMPPPNCASVLVPPRLITVSE